MALLGRIKVAWRLYGGRIVAGASAGPDGTNGEEGLDYLPRLRAARLALRCPPIARSAFVVALPAGHVRSLAISLTDPYPAHLFFFSTQSRRNYAFQS